MKALKATLAVILMQTVSADQKPRVKYAVGSTEYHNQWEEAHGSESTYKQMERVASSKVVEHGRRPVVGILSEPLRGELVDVPVEGASYVPKTHVQFLEQAGIRVVPIDYHLSHEERVALFEKLNGVYVPGDSHITVSDEQYKEAFMHVLDYTTEQARIN